MATPKSSKAASRVAKRNSTSRRSGLIFPAGRVSTMLRRGNYSRRVSTTAGLYMTAVLQYLAGEVLTGATRCVRKGRRVVPRAIALAVAADEELGAMFGNASVSGGGVVASVNAALEKKKKGKKGAMATA